MRYIRRFFVLFRPDFVDRTILNGLNDTRRTKWFCDFLQEKFVIRTLLCDDKKASIIILRQRQHNK